MIRLILSSQISLCYFPFQQPNRRVVPNGSTRRAKLLFPALEVSQPLVLASLFRFSLGRMKLTDLQQGAYTRHLELTDSEQKHPLRSR